MNRQLFERLAVLVRYPRDTYRHAIEEALRAAPDCEPLRRFAAAAGSESLAVLQELYTRTFDLNPICAPELGWHLFGETYERGAFLARMRRELCRHGIEEGSELPDHMACAMELACRMRPEDAEFFVVACFAPAVRKMLQAIPNDNIFRLLIEAVREALEHDFPEALDVEAPVTLTVLNEGAMS